MERDSPEAYGEEYPYTFEKLEEYFSFCGAEDFVEKARDTFRDDSSESIKQFAEYFLGVEVEYRDLIQPSTVYGVYGNRASGNRTKNSNPVAARILIEESLSEEETAMTIAHEIGHHFLAVYNGAEKGYCSYISDGKVDGYKNVTVHQTEEFCELFARRMVYGEPLPEITQPSLF